MREEGWRHATSCSFLGQGGAGLSKWGDAVLSVGAGVATARLPPWSRLLRVSVGSSAPKLRLIQYTFVVVQRAFGAILTALAGHRHPADDGVYAGPDIDIRAVCYQRDLVAGRKLITGQMAYLRKTIEDGARSAARHPSRSARRPYTNLRVSVSPLSALWAAGVSSPED
jgi:hypothetical protein